MDERAELVATVLHAVRRLAVLGPPPDGIEAMVQADEIYLAKDLIESFGVSCMAALDQSVTLDEYGYGTAKRFLLDAARMRGCEAEKRQSLARMLPKLPATAAALAAGRVSFDHAVAINYGCRTVEACDIAKAEAILLELALKAGVDDVVKAGRVIRYTIDPDGAAKNRERRESETHLRLSPALDGFVHVHGLIPGSTAQQLQAATDAFAPLTEGEKRSKEKRTLAALQALLDLQVTASVSVIVDVKDLVAGTGVGRFLDGTFVPADRITDMATRGWLTRIMTAGNQLLNVGRAKRFATPAIRKAVEWRDRHCVVRGCMVPARYCQVDHYIEWADGGGTSYQNNALNCLHHNNWKHRHKHRIHRRKHTDGHVEYLITQPTGWKPTRQCTPPTPPSRGEDQERRSA